MSTAATTAPAVSRRPLTGPLVTAGAVVVALGLLALRDPHRIGSYGVCPLYATTGLYCPLCGGLRGTWELLHGNVAAAWALNPLWVCALPVLLVAWASWVAARAQGRPIPRWIASGRTAVIYLAVIVVFGVLRNLPGLSGLLSP